MAFPSIHLSAASETNENCFGSENHAWENSIRMRQIYRQRCYFYGVLNPKMELKVHIQYVRARILHLWCAMLKATSIHLRFHHNPILKWGFWHDTVLRCIFDFCAKSCPRSTHEGREINTTKIRVIFSTPRLFLPCFGNRILLTQCRIDLE